jgi:hypothetical protein
LLTHKFTSQEFVVPTNKLETRLWVREILARVFRAF